MATNPNQIVEIGPFIGIVSQLICWSGLVIVLTMFKSFVSRGFSMAIAEFLLKQCNQEQREKLTRWFGDQNIILDELKNIKDGMKKND